MSDDTESARWWRELEIDARLAEPRYAKAYGACPLCRGGGTRPVQVLGVWWFVCDTCHTRWPSTFHDFRLLPDDAVPLDDIVGEEDVEDLRSEFLYSEMLDLASYEQLDPIAGDIPFHGERNPLMFVQTFAQDLELAITAFERLPLPDPFAEAFATTDERWHATRRELFAEGFPAMLTPVPDALLRELQLALEGFSRFGSSPRRYLEQLHADAIDGYPELAALIRGARGIRWLRNTLSARGVLTEEIGRTVEAFQLSIASALHARGQGAPWAGLLIETLPALRLRLDAERSRREVYHAREAERRQKDADQVAAAAAAAARAAAEAEWRTTLVRELSDVEAVHRRERLAERFAINGPYLFTVHGETISGDEASRRVQAGAPFDVFYRALHAGGVMLPRVRA